MLDVLLVLVTGTVTAVLVPLLSRPARRLGLVDRPGGRKDHVGDVPLVGGMAIALGFFAVWGIAGAPQGWPFLAAILAMLALGAMDDLHFLSTGLRLFVQITVALFCVLVGGIVLPHIGNVLGTGAFELGWAAAPFTVLCLVGLMNAVNMSDGLDGLAGGMVAAMLILLLVTGAIAGHVQALLTPALLLGAVAGFLVWNFPRLGARPGYVFLGDAGSMALAVAVGWLAIELAFGHGERVPPMVFAWILALPVIETVVLMIRRLMRLQSPLRADREHLHHYLLWFGLSRRATTLLLVLTTLLLGGAGVLAWLEGIPEQVMFWAFVGLGVVHLLVVEFLFPRLGDWLQRRRATAN